MTLPPEYNFTEHDLSERTASAIKSGDITPHKNWLLIRDILDSHRYDLILRLFDAGMVIEPKDFLWIYNHYSTYISLSALTDRVYPTPDLLYYAARSGWWQLMEILIEQGIDIDPSWYESAVLENGAIAIGLLHDSAWHSKTDTVRVLLQNGADVHKRDYYGYTALMRACEFKFGHHIDSAGAVFWLLRCGANPRETTNTGATALLLCTETSLDSKYDVVRAQIAELLLNYGSDSNGASAEGATPLMFAARDNNELLAHILLRHGADRTICSARGKTALHVAIERKNKKIEAMLRS